MVQTKYRMLLGTSKKQWEELAVMDDGRMMLYFHGRDRSVTQQVTAITEGEWAGWLRSEKGSMWPGLESGRWQLMDDVVETNTNDTNSTNEVAESETTTDNTDCTDNYVEPEVIEENTTFAIKRVQGDTCINHAEREQSQDCESSVNCTNYTNNEPVMAVDEPVIIDQPRPRRQRKQRKPRVERQEPLTINHEPLTVSRHQTSSTMKAIGMVAAATVALFVIYETGLLIPLGLIGLATGGILK